MRHTQVKDMLEDHEKRIRELEIIVLELKEFPKGNVINMKGLNNVGEVQKVTTPRPLIEKPIEEPKNSQQKSKSPGKAVDRSNLPLKLLGADNSEDKK